MSAADAIVGAGTKTAGFFQRLLQRMIEGQERKATAMVRHYLSGLSDQHLADLGYGPVAIKALRKHASSSPGAAWL
jgi:hypothetical protein